MCGVVALLSNEPVNQRLYDALLLLQHRGQDAAGIATLDGLQFHMHKAMGLVRDIFRTRNMRDLTGNVGVGHVRYPTQGCASSNQESQPFYVNAPFGIMFAHNGNLTNAEELKQELYETDRRHINTTSDSEVLLNVLANEISRVTADRKLDADGIFEAFTDACAAPTPSWRSSPARAFSPSATRTVSVLSASAPTSPRRARRNGW